MNTAPKLTHIAANTARRDTVVTALCGRRVSFMATGREAEATCTRCVAESLSRPAAVSLDGR